MKRKQQEEIGIPLFFLYPKEKSAEYLSVALETDMAYATGSSPSFSAACDIAVAYSAELQRSIVDCDV